MNEMRAVVLVSRGDPIKWSPDMLVGLRRASLGLTLRSRLPLTQQSKRRPKVRLCHGPLTRHTVTRLFLQRRAESCHRFFEPRRPALALTQQCQRSAQTRCIWPPRCWRGRRWPICASRRTTVSWPLPHGRWDSRCSACRHLGAGDGRETPHCPKSDESHRTRSAPAATCCLRRGLDSVAPRSFYLPRLLCRRFNSSLQFGARDCLFPCVAARSVAKRIAASKLELLAVKTLHSHDQGDGLSVPQHYDTVALRLGLAGRRVRLTAHVRGRYADWSKGLNGVMDVVGG